MTTTSYETILNLYTRRVEYLWAEYQEAETEEDEIFWYNFRLEEAVRMIDEDLLLARSLGKGRNSRSNLQKIEDLEKAREFFSSCIYPTD